MSKRCANCGDEIVNDERCHDARTTCSTECSIYLDDKNEYFEWVKWQLENNVGFEPKFNT